MKSVVFILALLAFSCGLNPNMEEAPIYRAFSKVERYSINGGWFEVSVQLSNDGDDTSERASLSHRVTVSGETIGEGTSILGPLNAGENETYLVTVEGNQARMAELGFDRLNIANVVTIILSPR